MIELFKMNLREMKQFGDVDTFSFIDSRSQDVFLLSREASMAPSPASFVGLMVTTQNQTKKYLCFIKKYLQDVFDLDYFQGRVEALKKAFPEEFFTHALAVKANSIRGVLLEACKHGLGGECASLQEAKHCLSLGIKLKSKSLTSFS